MWQADNPAAVSAQQANRAAYAKALDDQRRQNLQLAATPPPAATAQYQQNQRHYPKYDPQEPAGTSVSGLGNHPIGESVLSSLISVYLRNSRCYTVLQFRVSL